MHLFSEFGDGLRSYFLPHGTAKHSAMEPSARLVITVVATMVSVALWVGIYALIRSLI